MNAVRAAWNDRDFTALDAALLELWRETPDPFLADLLVEIGLVANETVDPALLKKGLPNPALPPHVIPELEAVVRKGSRSDGDAMAKRVERLNNTYTRDPRLAALAVSLLRKSPSPRNIPLDRQVWKMLYDQLDPRSIVELRGVTRSERRYIPDEEHGYSGGFGTYAHDGVGAVVNKRIQEFLALADQPQWVERRLDKAVLKEILELRRAFRAERRGIAVGSQAQALVDAICEDYADDAPRLVYADYLSQAGNPRGEYISLAIAKHSGKRLSKPENARLTALFTEHRAGWTRDVAPAIRLRKTDFERGFLKRCRIVKSNLEAQTKVVGAKSWATVREVDLQKSDHHIVLLDPAFRCLRKVHGFSTVGQVAAVARYHPGLWELSFQPDATRTKPPDEPSNLRRLRTLTLRPAVRQCLPWLVGDLVKPLRVLRLEWPLQSGIEALQRAMGEALPWMLANRSVPSKRTEVLFTLDRRTPVEIHTRNHREKWQIAVKLRCTAIEQIAVLGMLDRDELRSVDTDLPEVRERAREMFPNVGIVS